MSRISLVLCLSLLFSNTVFAGGSTIQLTTAISPVATIAYLGVRSPVINFSVHAEPQFIETAKIKDISVSCFTPTILNRAYLLSDSGKVLGTSIFRNDRNNAEAGAMITAKIRPTRLARIPSGDIATRFQIAITPKKNAPVQEIECGISHVTFLNLSTRAVVSDESVLLDDSMNFENFVTQRISILENTPENNRIIRIQGK